MNLKKIGKVFRSKFVVTGPSFYIKKRIYRATVSQSLRNTIPYCHHNLFFSSQLGKQKFLTETTEKCILYYVLTFMQCTRRPKHWALLGYYAVSSGNFLLTFRDNLSVPNSKSRIQKERGPSQAKSSQRAKSGRRIARSTS